jgi:hypothetical protein
MCIDISRTPGLCLNKSLLSLWMSKYVWVIVKIDICRNFTRCCGWNVCSESQLHLRRLTVSARLTRLKVYIACVLSVFISQTKHKQAIVARSVCHYQHSWVGLLQVIQGSCLHVHLKRRVQSNLLVEPRVRSDLCPWRNCSLKMHRTVSKVKLVMRIFESSNIHRLNQLV